MKYIDERQLRHDRIAAVCEASEIIRLHQSDNAITELEIAGKLGLTEYGVRWLLVDRGFSPRYTHETPKPKSPTVPKPKTPRTPKPRDEAHAERRRKIVELYESGRSLREIAEVFGVTKDRIRQILVHEGVQRRPTGKKLSTSESRHLAYQQRQQERAERNKRIVAMYLSGMSLRTIEPRVDITLEAIREVLLRAGVQLRPKGGRRYLTEEMAS